MIRSIIFPGEIIALSIVGGVTTLAYLFNLIERKIVTGKFNFSIPLKYLLNYLTHHPVTSSIVLSSSIFLWASYLPFYFFFRSTGDAITLATIIILIIFFKRAYYRAGDNPTSYFSTDTLIIFAVNIYLIIFAQLFLRPLNGYLSFLFNIYFFIVFFISINLWQGKRMVIISRYQVDDLFSPYLDLLITLALYLLLIKIFFAPLNSFFPPSLSLLLPVGELFLLIPAAALLFKLLPTLTRRLVGRIACLILLSNLLILATIVGITWIYL